MTPNHDHATLFVAPRPAPGSETTGTEQPAVDEGADEMRRLRHPFEAHEASDLPGHPPEHGRRSPESR